MATTSLLNDSPTPVHRVLLADADDDSRARYREVIRDMAVDVVEARDGRDALVYAFTRTPSLVIAELHLPFIDGIALCGILRSDHATATVPIAVLTDDSRPSQRTRALRAGADVVLAKPTPSETLLMELHRLMAKTATARERSAAVVAKAVEQIDRAEALTAERHRVLSRTHPRFDTTTPPQKPPDLKCIACDLPLIYERSYVGGTNARQPEQWDYFTCPRCGEFQYRHRTRKLRRVG